MKNQTKKLIFTQKGELNKNIKNQLAHCVFANGIIYTGYYLGSGRFTTAHSAMSTVISILNAQGYKFTTRNDSPRGGVSGECVKLSKTAYEFVLNLTKK
jgi:hypothetical protein